MDPTAPSPEPAPGFPFSRQSWSLDGLLSHAWEAFTREWLMLCLLLLVVFGLVFGVMLGVFVVEALLQLLPFALDEEELGKAIRENPRSLLGEHAAGLTLMAALFLVRTVLNAAVESFAALGLGRVSMDVLQGGRVDFGRLFSQVVKLPAALALALLMAVGILLYVALCLALGGATLFALGGPSDRSAVVAGIAVGAGTLLVLGVPVIWAAIGFRMGQFELAYAEPGLGMGEALERGFRIARGTRWYWIGFSVLVIPIVFVGLLVCCVGVIPALMLSQLVLTAAFLTFRGGALE